MSKRELTEMEVLGWALLAVGVVFAVGTVVIIVNAILGR